MENHHFYWVNPLYMAIFNSFLYVYQAGYIGYLQMTSPFLVPGYFGILRIRVDSPESDYRLTRKRPYLQFRIIQKSDYISIVSLVSTLRPRSCCIHLFHGTRQRAFAQVAVDCYADHSVSERNRNPESMAWSGSTLASGYAKMMGKWWVNHG